MRSQDRLRNESCYTQKRTSVKVEKSIFKGTPFGELRALQKGVELQETNGKTSPFPPGKKLKGNSVEEAKGTAEKELQGLSWILCIICQ